MKNERMKFSDTWMHYQSYEGRDVVLQTIPLEYDIQVQFCHTQYNGIPDHLTPKKCRHDARMFNRQFKNYVFHRKITTGVVAYAREIQEPETGQLYVIFTLRCLKTNQLCNR